MCLGCMFMTEIPIKKLPVDGNPSRVDGRDAVTLKRVKELMHN